MFLLLTANSMCQLDQPWGAKETGFLGVSGRVTADMSTERVSQ